MVEQDWGTPRFVAVCLEDVWMQELSKQPVRNDGGEKSRGLYPTFEADSQILQGRASHAKTDTRAVPVNALELVAQFADGLLGSHEKHWKVKFSRVR